MSNPTAIDFADLQYYDSKIKKYVDDKAAEVIESTSDLSERIAINSSDIENLKDHINEDEAAILELQRDDKLIREDIADIRVELANKLDESAMKYLATKQYVKDQIALAELGDQDIDLSDYYTKSEVDNALSLSIEAVNQDIETVQNIAGQNSVKLFQIDSDLVDINAKLDTIPTKTSDLINDSNFLTEHQDLSEYAKKTEIPSIEGLATETYVDNKFAEVKVPTKVSEFDNDAGYVKQLQLTTFQDDAPYNPYIGLDWEITDSSLIQCLNSIASNVPVSIQYVGFRYSANTIVSYKRFSDSDIELSIPYFYYGTSQGDSDSDGTLDIKTAVLSHEKVCRYRYSDNCWKYSAAESYCSFVEIELPTKVSDLINDKQYITKEDIPETDLSNYYNKSETENLIAEAVKDIEHPTVDLDGYATEEWVNNQGFLKEHQDLSEYALKSEIPTDYLKEIPPEYVTESELDSKGYLTEHQSLDDYATKDLVQESIESVEAKIPSLDGYATQSWVEDKKYLTEHQDISGKLDRAEYEADKEQFALKSDIPDINGLASTEYVDKAIEAIEIPDTSKFITEEQVEAKGYLTAIPGEYITEAELAKELENIEHPTVDLSDYYTAEQTDKAISDAIANINIPETDLSDYYTREEVDGLIPDTSKFLEAIPDEYITADELAAEGFIKEHQDLSDYALKSDIPTDYIKEIPSEYITETELESRGYLTEHQDLSAYAKKDDIKDFITEEALDGYATEEWVNNKNYLVASDIENKADRSELFSRDYNDLTNKPDIPSIEGLATVAQVELKADAIPFTEDKPVVNAIGGFNVNDSLKGMTIAAILEKLLCVAGEIPEEPDEPDVPPEEPKSIVEKILANQIPMYAVNNDGVVAEIPFKLVDANAEPTESGFYVIKDAQGNIIEAGYQELQINNDSVYYVIALPKELDYYINIDMQTWDTNSNSWEPAEDYEFTSDPSEVARICGDAEVDVSQVDNTVYIIWAFEDCPTGSILRYVIKEGN